jgi:hypothetical protein
MAELVSGLEDRGVLVTGNLLSPLGAQHVLLGGPAHPMDANFDDTFGARRRLGRLR